MSSHIAIVNPHTGQVLNQSAFPIASLTTGDGQAHGWSPDGQYFAYMNSSNILVIVRLSDLYTYQKDLNNKGVIRYHTNGISFSPNGYVVLPRSSHSGVLLIDLATGEEVDVGEWVTDPETGEQVFEPVIPPPSSAPYVVMFSPNGNYLFTNTGFYDTSAANPKDWFALGFGAPRYDCDWSRDSSMFVSRSSPHSVDPTVTVLAIPSGNIVGEWNASSVIGFNWEGSRVLYSNTYGWDVNNFYDSGYSLDPPERHWQLISNDQASFLDSRNYRVTISCGNLGSRCGPGGQGPAVYDNATQSSLGDIYSLTPYGVKRTGYAAFVGAGSNVFYLASGQVLSSDERRITVRVYEDGVMVEEDILPATVGDPFSYAVNEYYAIQTVEGSEEATHDGATITIPEVSSHLTLTVNVELIKHTVSLELIHPDQTVLDQATVTPAEPQTVVHGDTTAFQLSLPEGYTIGAVNGACVATYSDTEVTTSEIVEECSITLALTEATEEESDGGTGDSTDETGDDTDGDTSDDTDFTFDGGFGGDTGGDTGDGSWSPNDPGPGPGDDDGTQPIDDEYPPYESDDPIDPWTPPPEEDEGWGDSDGDGGTDGDGDSGSDGGTDYTGGGWSTGTDITCDPAATPEWPTPTQGEPVGEPGRFAPGRSVRRVDESVLARFDPDWAYSVHRTRIRHWMRDDNEPQVFFVEPPSNGESFVEVAYAENPPPITWPGQPLAVPDRFAPAVVEYVLAIALAKEGDAESIQSSQLHYQRFLNLVSGNSEAKRTWDPRPGAIRNEGKKDV